MKNNKGAAMIEFTLVLPLLLTLVFGIIEFGIIIYDKAMITNASREGARGGIVMAVPRISEGEIKGIVKNYCNTHLISLKGGTGPTITDSNIVVTGALGSYPDNLTVTVNYKYGFLIIPQFVTSITGTGDITLTATTVMRME